MMMTIGRNTSGVVALVMLAACSRPEVSGGSGSSSTKKIAQVTIAFTVIPGTITVPAGCAATALPATVQVKKTEDVEFSIIDFCGVTKGYTVDVELKWSGPFCSDGTQNPLSSPPTGKNHIKSGIKPGCKDGDVFKYEIWVAGTKYADPELEISM